jgi:hypothetical protein
MVILNWIERILKLILDHSKLSFMKLKVILFFTYIALFSYNYVIKINKKNDEFNLSFDPGNNVPTSVIIGSLIIMAFLVFIDFILIKSKNKKIIELINSNQISESQKSHLIEEFLKSK